MHDWQQQQWLTGLLLPLGVLPPSLPPEQVLGRPGEEVMSVVKELQAAGKARDGRALGLAVEALAARPDSLGHAVSLLTNREEGAADATTPSSPQVGRSVSGWVGHDTPCASSSSSCVCAVGVVYAICFRPHHRPLVGCTR